jgi:transcriptional regulator with XRE-family HTH domain
MKRPAQNVVGPQIQRLRVHAGLTQDALAAKCGVAGWDVSRGTLAKIEARVRCVNDAELFILARVLKAELPSLFPRDLTLITSALSQ